MIIHEYLSIYWIVKTPEFDSMDYTFIAGVNSTPKSASQRWKALQIIHSHMRLRQKEAFLAQLFSGSGGAAALRAHSDA
jgi:hypothetical protein